MPALTHPQPVLGYFKVTLKLSEHWNFGPALVSEATGSICLFGFAKPSTGLEDLHNQAGRAQSPAGAFACTGAQQRPVDRVWPFPTPTQVWALGGGRPNFSRQLPAALTGGGGAGCYQTVTGRLLPYWGQAACYGKGSGCGWGRDGRGYGGRRVSLGDQG